MSFMGLGWVTKVSADFSRYYGQKSAETFVTHPRATEIHGHNMTAMDTMDIHRCLLHSSYHDTHLMDIQLFIPWSIYILYLNSK